MADLLSQIVARVRGDTRQKDLAALHPEISDREHIATLRSDSIAQEYGGYSYLTALGDYERHNWVRKAVKVLTDNFAPLPILLLRDEEPFDGAHEITDLLAGMNDAMSSVDVWQQWVIDMLLGGEEAWELVKDSRGNYVEVFPRQPHTLAVTPDAQRKRYFQVAHYTIEDGSGAPYTLPTDELIHFKFFNPRNPWRGLSVIGAVRNSILIDTYAQVWSRLFFRKSARPDYAVVTPQGTTKSEREQIEMELGAKFGGTANAHKPVVLEQGVTDIKFLDWPPKDLEWVNQRELARDEIGAIFGVPDEIMGWGRDTYENFDTALFVLWSLTLLPLCGFRDTHLTEFFRRVGKLKPNERLATDTSHVAALKKNLKETVEMIDRLCGRGVPFNAASQHLGFGLTVEGGDVGYLPVSLVPVASDASSGKQAMQLETRAPRKGIARAEIAPKGIEYDSVEHRALWERFVKRTDPHARRLGNVVARLFEQQEAEVLARLGEEAKSRVSQKDSPQQVADDPFDLDEWEARFRKEVAPILRSAVAEAGTDALLDLAIEIVFDVDAPEVIAFLRARGQRFAHAVNETTWQQLKDSLAAGLDNGELLPDLMARVETVMAGRIRSSSEAIARTEITGCANGGVIHAWDQSGVVEKKEWLSALDDRTRNHAAGDEFDHVIAHGETVGLDEPFEATGEPLQFPGDAGSPGNVINCRCSMVAHLGKSARGRDKRTRFSSNGHGKPKAVVAR